MHIHGLKVVLNRAVNECAVEFCCEIPHAGNGRPSSFCLHGGQTFRLLLVDQRTNVYPGFESIWMDKYFRRVLEVALIVCTDLQVLGISV